MNVRSAFGRSGRWLRRPIAIACVAAGLTLTASVVPANAAPLEPAAPAAAPSAWTPGPEIYGRSTPVTTTITMDDGTPITAYVVYPTLNGQRAPGTFPVLVTQNPYGNQLTDPTVAGDYFVKRGYIFVAAAVRGTGTSGGQADWFGTRTGKDGAAVVRWAAQTLDGTNGSIGLDGCSYLGVNQWSTAAEVGPNSPLKAIAPFCTNSDFYNDASAIGGIPTNFTGTVASVLPRGPQDNPQTDPLSVTVNQLRDGGDRSYRNDYWQQLSLEALMPRIVANGVPALSMAGWNDLFPAGNLDAYVFAQNAYYNRPVTAPIAPGAQVTGRYQAIVGPWTHGAHFTEASLQSIRLKWFDTLLKGVDTGMLNTTKPLHLFQNGANRWVDTAAWPPSPDARTFYLGPNGTLTDNAPTAPGTDTVSWPAPWLPATYNSAPVTQATTLDGPINATVYVASTTKDAEITATVNVVGPAGVVYKQGAGVLLASMRQLDTGKSWYGTGNKLIKPSHPLTQASQQLLTPGQQVRMDISVLPNFREIPAGSKIQLVISSQPPGNFHTVMQRTPQQKANLGYGVYTLSRSPAAPSSVTLPLTNPGAFTASPDNWGPSS